MKQMQKGAIRNQLSSTNEINVGRREFIKKAGLGAAGLGAISLGVGFGAFPAFAQDGPTKYKPVTSNYMEVHKDLIVIDGTTNLTGYDKDVKYLDWYKQGGATAVVMTISAANMVAASNVRHKDDTLDLLGFIHKLLQTRDDIVLVRSASDIEKAKKTGKLALFLQFQNAAVVERNLDLVNMYKALGINIMGIAYNERNQFANGVTEAVDGGLSTLGVQLIERLNETKIIVDVAHTGAQSGLDAVAASKSPVVLSHSNSRNYRPSPRNAPDELIKAVAKSGGLVGAVMYPPFVAEKAFPTMDDYVGNIDYLVQLVGIDHVGISSDYTYQISVSPAEQKAGWKQMIDSGVWTKEAYPYDVLSYPQGIETPKTFFYLTDALLGRGYKKEDIAKLWGGNWLRIMREVIG